MKRLISKGTFWINIIDEEITKIQEKEPWVIPIITDIRYAFYPSDEFFWLTEKKDGLLVYIERLQLVLDPLINNPDIIRVKPANEVEAKHDKELFKKCHYSVSWMTSPSKDLKVVDNWCRNHVTKFIESESMQNFLKKCQK